MADSATFNLSPDSWLGLRIDSGRQEVVTPRKALAFECRPNKGEEVEEPLKSSLAQEVVVIEGLPDEGLALRTDRIEKQRAAELKKPLAPSVDVCICAGHNLMLVECKYKAMPETSIMKSVDSFNRYVARKFEASKRFFLHEGARSLGNDRIVLFNADSKDKVLSMFMRLQLESDGSSLRQYKIMDTADFWKQYGSCICA